jgi:hypothetical protein
LRVAFLFAKVFTQPTTGVFMPTKEPLEVSRQPHGFVITDGDRMVAKTAGTTDEDRDNAKVFSAAHELGDALYALLRSACPPESEPTTIKAKAALRKAGYAI